MPSPDHFAGPLAAVWPQLRTHSVAGLLASPEHSLPVPPASDRRTWGTGASHAATLDALRSRAHRDLSARWPTALAQDYARYFRDGDRDSYEQLIFARQHRLSRAAVLAAVTLEPAWIDQVADGVTLLCEQSSWCWPAHDTTHSAHGAVVPTVTDPVLDLGAGEVAAQLAWLDQLLAEQLDEQVPGLRARIRHEVDRRVLVPFAVRRDWHWLGLDGDVHNWSAWIHGNVLVAALRLVDEAARRAALVDLTIEGLDRYLGSIPNDGAIDEGHGYWWNGACRALEALDVLAHATRGALDATGIQSLRQTVAFPHRVHLGGDWYVNHADGTARPPRHQPWQALHHAARRYGDPDAQAHAAAQRGPDQPVATEEQGLGRLLRALTDPEWVAAVPGTSPLPRDAWFASTQVLLARPAAGDRAGLTLVAKGGHNGEHHNHNDVGSFLVALHGVPALVDAGRPTYTRQTFGPDRYAIWTMQSLWHNVPSIRATAQSPGREYRAHGVRATVDDTHAELTLDLAGAYPRTDIAHWRRTARLDRADATVRVTDSWHLDPTDSTHPTDTRPQPHPTDSTEPTVIHLLAAGDVRVGAGHAEISALDDAGVVILTWEPADAPCTTTVRDLDDPMLSDVWGGQLTRLDIDVTAAGPVGTFVLTVKEQR